jgi:hypothetical protein
VTYLNQITIQIWSFLYNRACKKNFYSTALQNIINDNKYVLLVAITSQSFPHSWLITVFVTRVKRRMTLEELQTAYQSRVPEFIPCFKWDCVAGYLVFHAIFCGSLFLLLWCVVYVRQAIKTAARDLVLHGIVSQSNRPSIINGVCFYDCCSNINCRLSRFKKASNIKYQFYLNFNWFPLIDLMRFK